MPFVFRFYLRHVAIGFGLAAIFCAALLWLDIAGLRHLVLGSAEGRLAGLVFFVLNGIVFAGVQFGIAVMAMAERKGGPRGGKPTVRAAVKVDVIRR